MVGGAGISARWLARGRRSTNSAIVTLISFTATPRQVRPTACFLLVGKEGWLLNCGQGQSFYHLLRSYHATQVCPAVPLLCGPGLWH